MGEGAARLRCAGVGFYPKLCAVGFMHVTSASYIQVYRVLPMSAADSHSPLTRYPRARIIQSNNSSARFLLNPAGQTDWKKTIVHTDGMSDIGTVWPVLPTNFGTDTCITVLLVRSNPDTKNEPELCYVEALSGCCRKRSSEE